MRRGQHTVPNINIPSQNTQQQITTINMMGINQMKCDDNHDKHISNGTEQTENNFLYSRMQRKDMK